MGLVSSSKLKKPEFKYVSARPAGTTENSATVVLSVSAQNPNSIGLRNVFADFELSTQGKQFAKGHEVPVTLAPNGETMIEVPTEVVFSEVIKALGPVGARIAFGARSIPMEAHVRFYGRPTVYNEIQESSLFSFNYDMNIKFDVPVPKEKIDNALERLRDRFKKAP
jgi:LEA14-like dessication related protein